MPSPSASSPEELDRLLMKLAPSIAEILREWSISEEEAEELIRTVLVRLAYRWSRIADPERWLLSAVDNEAQDRADRRRPDPEDPAQ
jgi:DNA-directed RNA polymerase specialized sigma24 family protein